MTSSTFTTDGAPTSELPPVQRQDNETAFEGEDDDEGFQTVVSKRTAKLLQQQQQYHNRYNRKGYNSGYGHNYGNGRHYHRQYGPPHSNSGTNSNSSASSIPEELPKERETQVNQHEQNQTADIPSTPRPQSVTVLPTSPPVIAWARIAAGDAKAPKHDVLQSLGNSITSPTSVSNSFDVKPLAISLVTSACDGIQDDIPVKKTSSEKKTNLVSVTLAASPKQQSQAQQQNQSQSASSISTPPRPQPQIIIPPPQPSVWGRRAPVFSGGHAKPDVAQTAVSSNSTSSVSVVTGAGRRKLQTNGDWPSLGEAVKPAVQKLDSKTVGSISQTDRTPSESATDSGSEEILRITGPELSDEKWPLPLVSNGIGKAHGNEPSFGLIDKNRQSRHSSGDAMSSSGCDHGGTGEGQEENHISTETKKKKKNKKASKPKWVPLILEDEPPKPPPKPKKRKDKFMEKGNNQHRNGDSYGGAIGGDGSSECATPTEGFPRTKGSGPGRGGRTGTKGKHRNYQNYKFYKETSDPSQVPDTKGEGYTDYPTEFTTVNSMYPLTEFVMPYANYSTYSPPPEAQSYSYAPIAIEDSVLTLLIQKQIEYYFSEENLERDFYLRRKMDSEGYIPISLITSFYRIQSMTQDYNVVLNAIKASELIEVREEEENCASARPVVTPTKWPIIDTIAAAIPLPPSIVKSFITTVTPIQ